MANLLMESFSIENAADLSQSRWTSGTVTGIGTSYGRLGGYGVDLLGNNLTYNIPGSPSTIIVGGAYNFRNSSVRTWIKDISNNPQLALTYNTGTSLLSIRDYNDNIIGSANYTLSPNTWHYIEIEVLIANTAVGTVTTNIDGVNIAALTLTGIKTSNTTNSAGRIQFLCDSGTNEFYLADVYINDTSGSYNNGFLGDMKMLPSRATANGDTNNFTIGGSSPAATNYQSINERVPDYDVTYVSDATVGNIDLYQYGTPSGIHSIQALQVSGFIKKDDATVRQVQLVMKLSGVQYFSPTFTLSTSYQYYQWTQDVNPATSLPWVVGDYSGVQFGIKVIT